MACPHTDSHTGLCVCVFTDGMSSLAQTRQVMNELNTLKQTEQENRDSKGHCVQTCRSIKWMEWWRRNGNTRPPLYLRSALMEGGCYWEVLSIVSWQQLHIHGEKSKTTALCVKSTETPRYTCLFICTYKCVHKYQLLNTGKVLFDVELQRLTLMLFGVPRLFGWV